jgi:hypothetical protein
MPGLVDEDLIWVKPYIGLMLTRYSEKVLASPFAASKDDILMMYLQL